jgi:hypothetical protein
MAWEHEVGPEIHQQCAVDVGQDICGSAFTEQGELLEVLLICDRNLLRLTVTESAANSPTTTARYRDFAQPMLDSLRRADFVLVPKLTNDQLSKRFGQFSLLCGKVSGTGVAAENLAAAVTRVREYSEHIRTCTQAELNGTPLPAPVAVPNIGT